MAEREPQPQGGEITDTGVGEVARKTREELARKSVPAADSIGKPPHEKQPFMERVFDFKTPNNPLVVGTAATGLVAGVGARDTIRALFRGAWETLRGVVTGKERKELSEGWKPGVKAAGGDTHLRPRRTVKEPEHRVDHGDHGGGHGGDHGGGGHGGDHGGGGGGHEGGGGDHGGGGGGHH